MDNWLERQIERLGSSCCPFIIITSKLPIQRVRYVFSGASRGGGDDFISRSVNHFCKHPLMFPDSAKHIGLDPSTAKTSSQPHPH